jgi:hypothetical protein
MHVSASASVEAHPFVPGDPNEQSDVSNFGLDEHEVLRGKLVDDRSSIPSP